MTNSELFRKIARERHITLSSIADAVGLTRQALSKKINNTSEFKAREILTISEILHLTNMEKNEIFFSVCRRYAN